MTCATPTLQEPAGTTASDPWTPVEQACDTALALSRNVLTRLESGAEAWELSGLLSRERDALDELRAGLRDLGSRLPAGANHAGRRDAVAGRLTELIGLDERSHELLSRRGVRLKPGRRRAGSGKAS